MVMVWRGWLPQRLGYGARDGAALFVTVVMVAGGAVIVAAMLAYGSRPVFVPESQTTD